MGLDLELQCPSPVYLLSVFTANCLVTYTQPSSTLNYFNSFRLFWITSACGLAWYPPSCSYTWTEWSAVTCLTVTCITPVPVFWFRSIPLACGRESGSEAVFPRCLLTNQPMCSPWVVPSLVWCP